MAQLPGVTLQCETVTPLFLGGADPRGAPELRPPSLRGALRFWFRALLADPNLAILREHEACVFGSQQHASPLRIRMSFDQSPPVQQWDPPRWPPGSSGTGGKVNGLVYLGFAFRAPQGQQARRAIDAGWRFQVHLSACHEDVLRQALAAVWALLNIGGLGSRTRRGFGTIRIVKPPVAAPTGVPALVSAARTPQELAAQLADGLRVARQALRANTSNTPLDYPALAPQRIKATVLGHTWPSWHAALADIGQLMAQFRQGLSPTMRDLLGSSPAPPYARAGFGLPIVYYDPATHQSLTLEATTISRRASPLWIRPLSLATGQYAVVLWLSRAPFWPHDSRLQYRLGKKTPTLPDDVSLNGVEQFIATCTKQRQGYEVAVQ
jgi:CRISPR-associated protein Cmr1